MKYGDKCVVLFSGGQDTTTCLAWAKEKFKEVYALTFDYGQTNHGEMGEVEQAVTIAEMLEVKHKVVNIRGYASVVDSALTGSGGDPGSAHPAFNDKPFSVVPNRNAVFITIAHAYCQKIRADGIIIGACKNDYANYYDCRSDVLKGIIDALNKCSDHSVDLYSPLIDQCKEDIFTLAEKFGVLDIVLNYSHSCYKNSSNKNEWGHGCGECAQCINKAEGYRKFLGGKNG